MKRFKIALVVLCFSLFAFPYNAFALPSDAAVHEVADATAFSQAIERAKTDSSDNAHVIKLTADITIPTASNENLDDSCFVVQGNVTILGDGHTLSLSNYFFNIRNGGTLTFGKSDGSDALVVKGGDDTQIHGIIHLGFMGGNGRTFNMYEGVTLTNSHVAGGTLGAAVGVNNGTFNMYGGTISNCTNKSGSSMGGAVAVRSDGQGRDSVVFNMYGGSIEGCVSGNSTSPTHVLGGAVFVHDGTFNMKGGSISGNKIKKGDGLYGAGAGACLSKSNVTISGGSITNNVTDHTDNKRAYGGGLYIEDSTVAITGGVVSGNSTDCGGGAFLTGCDGATVSGMSFADNQASSYGGGLYTNGANISLADVTITGNATEGYGGGIYAVGSGDVTIDGATTISTNTAAAGGGIAHSAKSVMTVGENCLVANNRCTQYFGSDIAFYAAQAKDGTGPKGTLKLPSNPIPADKRPFTLTGNPVMRQLLPVDGWYSDYSYDAEGNVAGGWDPYHATAVKVNSPLTERTMIIAAFGGHAVTYRFDSSTEGKVLPDEVLALVPSDQGLHKVGETISAIAPTQASVKVKGGTWKFDGYDRDNFTLGDEDAEIRGTWSFHSDTSPSTKPDSGEGSNAANKDANAAGSDADSKAGPDDSSSKKLAQTDDALNGIAVAATVIMFAFACFFAVVGAILLRRNDRFVS